MNTNSTVPPEGINVSEYYTNILVGTHLSTALWGISCTQTFMYYYNYTNDGLGHKILVAFLWILHTASQGMLDASPWNALILRWGSLTELVKTNVLLVYHIPLLGVVILTVQNFYLLRIYRLGGKKWLPFVCCMAVFTLFPFAASFQLLLWGIAAASTPIDPPSGSPPLHSSFWAVSAFVDIAISSSLVYLLCQGRDLRRRRPGFRSKNKMMYRLIFVTMICNIWTAIFAIIQSCLIGAFPKTLYYVPIELSLNGLYINSLLANLNSREYIRGSTFGINSYHVSGNISLGHMNSGTTDGSATKNPARQDKAIAIRVDTDVDNGSTSGEETRHETKVMSSSHEALPRDIAGHEMA